MKNIYLATNKNGPLITRKVKIIIFWLFIFIINSSFAKDLDYKKPVILNSSLQIFELFLKDVKLDRKLNGKIETKCDLNHLEIRLRYDNAWIAKQDSIVILDMRIRCIDKNGKRQILTKSYSISSNSISRKLKKFQKSRGLSPIVIENIRNLTWDVNIFKELESFEVYCEYTGNKFQLDNCNKLQEVNIRGDAMVLFKASSKVRAINFEDVSAEILKKTIRYSNTQRISRLKLNLQITIDSLENDTTTIPLNNIDFIDIKIKPYSFAYTNNSFIKRLFAPFKIENVERLSIDCIDFLDTLTIDLSFIETITNIYLNENRNLYPPFKSYDEVFEYGESNGFVSRSKKIVKPRSVMNLIVNHLLNTPTIQFNGNCYEIVMDHKDYLNLSQNRKNYNHACFEYYHSRNNEHLFYYFPIQYNLLTNSNQVEFYSSKKNFGMGSARENEEMVKVPWKKWPDGSLGYKSDELVGKHLRNIVVIKTPEELLEDKKKQELELEQKRIEAENRRIEAAILLKKQKEARDSSERLKIEKLEIERKIGGVILSNGIILKNIKLPNNFKFITIQNNVELCDWCKLNLKEHQIASTQEQINLMLYRIASATWGSLCCEAYQHGLSPKNLPYSENLSKINKFIGWYVQKFGYTKEQLALFAFNHDAHIIPYVYETHWSFANISASLLNHACTLNQQENNLLLNLKNDWTLDLLMKLPANKYIYTSKYCSPRCEKEANRK